VAPDRQQSAASHSLSLHRPLRVEEDGPRGMRRRHTDDCVQPWRSMESCLNGVLVASGINHGANLGDDITYSGTCRPPSRTLLGVPSFAVSLMARDARDGADFAVAAEFAARLAKAILETGLPLIPC